MFEPILRRRVLIAAAEQVRSGICSLFQADLLRDWEVIEADSLECAHFRIQLDPCDVVLLDCSLLRTNNSEELAWLAGQSRVPVLLLGDSNAETVAAELHWGIHYWMPRELAVHHVPLLAAMLRQAAEFGGVQRRCQDTSVALEDTRRQVSRLANLLWEAVPRKGRARWFTQRYMLERLEEEVIRTQRYGGSLSVILGEVDSQSPAPSSPSTLEGDEGGSSEERQPARWIADQISRVKRRCDVAGQYGLQGFMLILPQTDERGANSCCQRLRTNLAKPFGRFHASELSSVHLGIAGLSPEVRSAKSILCRAEARLEQEKLVPSMNRDRQGAVGVAAP